MKTRNSNPTLAQSFMNGLRGKTSMDSYWNDVKQMLTLDDGRLISISCPTFNAYADKQHKSAWDPSFSLIGIPMYENWKVQQRRSDCPLGNLIIMRATLHICSSLGEGQSSTRALVDGLVGKPVSMRRPTMLHETAANRLSFQRMLRQYVPIIGEALFLLDETATMECDDEVDLVIPDGLRDRCEALHVALSLISTSYPV